VELKLPPGQNEFTIMPEQHRRPFQENEFDRNRWCNLLVVTTAGFVILKIGHNLAGIT